MTKRGASLRFYPSEPALWDLDGCLDLEPGECLCGATERDYFGVRDRLEHSECPIHGNAPASRQRPGARTTEVPRDQ